ncbi:MAG: alpha/beta fold hydrolase [Frankiaceae bacterium]
MGRAIDVGDTSLWIDEKGAPEQLPILVLHAGPGLDSSYFGGYLDELAAAYRLVFIDQRAHGRSDRSSDPRTWTYHQMARDVSAVAAELGVERYAVLGCGFGAGVALQHAVDGPHAAVATIVCGALVSAQWSTAVSAALNSLEPPELADRAQCAWRRLAAAGSDAEVGAAWRELQPARFRDPHDPRFAEYRHRTAGLRFAAAVTRRLAGRPPGEDVVRRLPLVTQPVLVIAGRHDRFCPPAAARSVADAVAQGHLVMLDECASEVFVEDQAGFIALVRTFLDAHAAPA